MGIRMLNRFLREKASTSIQLLPLSSYTTKRIVVDASIYMYRYIGDNSLIENFYLLCLLFRKYNIHALFVFDGQPPKEKTNELKERASVKKKAKQELTELEKQLTNNIDDEEKQRLLLMKQTLKKQCIHIKAWDILDVKQIIDATGYQWVDAPGEADHLCAKLVRDGYADACMSEDMDMFVHGCPRVLRYMSLTRENFVEYNLTSILETLAITFYEFQELCILAGTDYTKWMETVSTQKEEKDENSCIEEKTNTKTIFQYYQDIQEYKQHIQSVSQSNKYFNQETQPFQDANTSFFLWCLDHDHMDSETYTHLEHIQSFFETENYPELNQEMYRPNIYMSSMNQTELRKILGYHHFY